MAEVRKADDWGLSASAFDLPALAETSPSTEALAAAEGKLTLEFMKYVRFAKGGRVNPRSLSRILDQDPPIKDPNIVIGELAAAASPDAYLRDQHPKHAGFQNLHKALLAARGGPSEPEVEVDPALKVVLPQTKAMLKLGVDAPQVALLRQRLKVPAEAGTKDTLFDEKLALALRAYQVEHGIKETGQLSGATRISLNREVEGRRAPDRDRSTQLLVLNMERWRWMPEDLGKVHVENNIPEFLTRTYKNGEVIFKERIIVGQPAWATPVFSADMQFVGFNPSWGMPDGIKMRELAPRLKAIGGGDFFSSLFGGGGSGAASIRAYGLKVYYGGREVQPESVNWGNADLRQYSFVQPPGGKNPLGIVKFRFPNKHDVYMHDTIERELFAQSSRALSHGCIRVQNPKKFAAIMIEEGLGLDEAGVQRAIAGGGEIHLEHRIPVHMTYFTAVADEDGRVSTYADIYGHDGKLSAALLGRAIRSEPIVETSSASEPAYDGAPAASAAQQKKGKKKTYNPPDTLADAISGFWMN
jgi:murein L,D-transpeptidase YcbB/YkuD